MANNSIQEGRVLNTANATGSTIAAGYALLAGDTLRVAINDIANGASGPAYAEGVFSLPATTADAWADGAVLYWDDATRKLTDTAGANKCVAIARGAKINGETTAQAKLWPFLL